MGSLMVRLSATVKVQQWVLKKGSLWGQLMVLQLGSLLHSRHIQHGNCAPMDRCS
jgi:hypothetical protein